MKRVLRVLVTIVFILGALAAAGISATVGWRPFIGPEARPLTDRRFEPTPARLERGEYLVRNVTVCLACHSELDTSAEGLPVKAGMAGAGKPMTPEEMPWLVAPNITPDSDTGAGSWTDDAIARAVREGIGHDGRALFPVMPYENYRIMSDEDLASVIAYMRSLPAVRHAPGRTEIPFPVSRLINSAPKPLHAPVAAPDLGTPEKRGAYLATLASCTDCHTPRNDKGQYLTELAFSGGNMVGYAPAVKAKASSNITQAVNGIPYYTDELFVETLRTGRVRERKLSDMMPWGHYRGMTDEDLRAIFAYLKSVKPIDHYIDNEQPATPCTVCGLQHGGGARNKKTE